jgi:hypothetical protein
LNRDALSAGANRDDGAGVVVAPPTEGHGSTDGWGSWGWGWVCVHDPTLP